MNYIAYLHQEHKSDYGVSFPDFPGCITAGRNLQEASRRAPEALSLHIAAMLEDGEALPEPSTMDDVKKDPASKGAMVFLVTTQAVDETIRINITARVSQIKQIDGLAREAGMTRSAYVVQAAVRHESVKHDNVKHDRAKRRSKWVSRTNSKTMKVART
jgi:predicted RNase H-like HicB family nuclease